MDYLECGQRRTPFFRCASSGARALSFLAVPLLLLQPRILFAGVGDVTLRTDHPQYAGEGAFQTVEDCVQFATAGRTDEQQKAIAMYLWLLTHQWHLMSPMEWCVPGRVPDSADPGNYETVVFDANRARFSYGYGLCGTVHAWNEPYWKALGMGARRREFVKHVNSEVFYDNRWHAFDTDMAGLLFRRDGIVAGYEDVQKDPTLKESVKSPFPHYPFDWPNDFNTMKRGWQEVAKRKAWYALYNGGFAAHPGIVHLRSGESFTRWYDRDHFGGFSKRRFWQNQKGGPFRQWTYFDNGTPFHDKAEANARSQAAYCNGEFVYEPKLESLRCTEGMSAGTANVAHRSTSPRLYSSDGQHTSVTFRHFSPYVICGDPVDDANPMSGAATDGLILEGTCVGDVFCHISADQGQTWHDVKLTTGSGESEDQRFRSDLTEFVKGRYGWQLRFSWSGESGLDSVRFVTTTQVCQAMYPRLTESGCNVAFRTTSQGVVAVLPNFGLPESNVTAFEETALRSANVRYKPRSPDSRFAYQSTDRKPAHVVFKVAAPQRLTEVRAAVRYSLSVPPPAGMDFQLQISTDNGETWQTFATADIPTDNEFSSGWLYGKAELTQAGCRNALVRLHMHSPGRRVAVIDARLYGIHEVPPPTGVTVEIGWQEQGEPKLFKKQFAAGMTSTTFRVPTSDDVKDEFVRITATD